LKYQFDESIAIQAKTTIHDDYDDDLFFFSISSFNN